MRKPSYVGPIGLLVTATACSGILGIPDSTLVPCNQDSDCPSSQPFCQSHQCVSASGGAWQTGGSSNVGTITITGGTRASSTPNGGTSATTTGGSVGTGGAGGTSAPATGGVIGIGGAPSGGASATTGGANAIGGAPNGGTSDTATTATGGVNVSGGTSSAAGGATIVVSGGSAAGGTDNVSTGELGGVGGQTATGGGGTGGLPSGGFVGTGGTSTGGSSSCSPVDGGPGACVPGTHRCHVAEDTSGNPVAGYPVYWQTCGDDCTWNTGTYCSDYCKVAEGCRYAPSCSTLYTSRQGLSYCDSTPMVGGTFNRSPTSDADGNQYCTTDSPCPATVGPFSLDVYEVTVNRFRSFVAHYPQSMPAEGSGKNEKIPTDMGWNKSWNALLPKDSTALAAVLMSCPGSTYTDSPGTQDFLPVGCLSWYLALAFCIWDGGRLPTEVEWYYAASGGEDRYYPWSVPSENPLITSDHAAYDLTAPLIVGTAAKGIARWGQYDLGGNILEWVADAYADLYVSTDPCIDCANLDPSSLVHVTRGGAYRFDETQLINSKRSGATEGSLRAWFGFRCARDL